MTGRPSASCVRGARPAPRAAADLIVAICIMTDISRILKGLAEGDESAVDRLFSAVYDELRRLAAARLGRERPGQTLEATALVHEAYVKLLGGEARQYQNRGQFFSAAAEAMRRILIDRARRKKRKRHGGGRARLDLQQLDLASPPPDEELLALDEALDLLENEDPVKARLVKLRFYAGLTLEQAAAALGLSRATCSRYWTYARAWLYHQVAGDES
jgi:RNA polymerase sigma factor (TIGR02999 family)